MSPQLGGGEPQWEFRAGNCKASISFINRRKLSDASTPRPPNYYNWPSIFWRPFLVVTLLNNKRHFHLHGAFYKAFHYE